MYNKEQLEVINTIDGTIQVIAAAGSGKTSSLIARIENMLKSGIEPKDIISISFTHASATELKKRLAAKKLKINTGTFHTICKRLLTEQGYDLSQFPNKYQIKREMEMATKEKDINMEDVLSWIDYQTSYGLTSSDTFKEKESQYASSGLLRDFFRIYEKYKARNDVYDFNDWLNITDELYEEGTITKKWKYVLVDEAQDLSGVQHRLIKHFCSTDNIFIVGDVNQSIYEFRSAIPELFMNFDKQQPTKVINMNTNYRSCNNIVEAANDFIRPYTRGYHNYKDTVADNKENGIVKCNLFEDGYQEAKYITKHIKDKIANNIPLSSIAVLYRNHSSSDFLEQCLKNEDIPYKTFNNESFYERDEIKMIISAMRLINDLTDDEAFENILTYRLYPTIYYKGDLIAQLRIEAGYKDYSLYEAFLDHKFEKPYENKNRDILSEMLARFRIQIDKHVKADGIVRNIVKAFMIDKNLKKKFTYDVYLDKIETINNFAIMAKDKTFLYFLKSCMNNTQKQNNNKDGVELRTIHSSKGLEYDITYVIGLRDNKFPNIKSSLISEARLMYVAVTRAKKELYVSGICDEDEEISTFYCQYERNVR